MFFISILVSDVEHFINLGSIRYIDADTYTVYFDSTDSLILSEEDFEKIKSFIMQNSSRIGYQSFVSAS